MPASEANPSQAQTEVRRKLLAATRRAKLARAQNGKPLPRALFLTDPTRTPDILGVVGHMPRGFGVIWRHHGDIDLAFGHRLARLCRQRGLILLVSADPQLAARIGAAGVHWPEKRLTGARRHRGIETAAAHSSAAINRARQVGVDAVLLSAVFPSRSPSAGPAIGSLRFRLMARNARLPVYALGGVNAGNAASAMHHAAGWAAIDAVIEGWK
jgi:thiamine-phosphate pyrophosphorylase